MIWDQIKNDFNDIKNHVKEQLIWFIDDQIEVIEGKRNHLCSKPQKAYVIDNDEAEKQQKLQRDKIRS
jgi:uncharacterized protein YjbJ (UPF0337 family)